MAVSVPPATVPSITGEPKRSSREGFSRTEPQINSPSSHVPRRYSFLVKEFAQHTKRADYDLVSKQPILPWIGLSEGEQAALVYEGAPNCHESIRKPTLWQRLFWKIGSAHELSTEFKSSIVVPNLQFRDRLMEYFYSDKYYRQRVKHRVIFMVTLGFILVGFQLWLGFSNAVRLRNQIADRDISMSVMVRPNLRKHRTLWGSDPGKLSFYTLACVDQSIIDLFLLCLWLILAYIPGMAPRMEIISITAQLLRATLLIFFAQGIYSPCAIQQGSRDIIMYNFVVATANISVFTAMGLARVRRACFISIAWLAGVIEVCIVMLHSSPSIESEYTPQLTLFIFIFATFPLLALAGRYRTEVSERESLFFAVVGPLRCATSFQELQRVRLSMQNLTAHLAEVEAVRNMDIDQALPEGVVPSEIVHVAVMELKMASKTAEALHSSLPNLIVNSAARCSAEFDRKQSHRASVKAKFYKPAKDAWTRTESNKSSWTRNAHVNQKLNNTQHLGVILEASIEVRSRITAALKLLSKSHDMYANKPKDPYHGAILFHALGHDGSDSFPKHKYASASTSGPHSRVGRSVSPRSSESNSMILLDDMPHLQHLPFLAGLGDFARNIGQTWDYNLLRIAKVTKDQALITTAMLLASPIAERLPFVFDWIKFFNFMKIIQNDYGASDKIPYHNRTHGAIHAHTATVLLTWLHYNDFATPLECLAVLIASLCHDVGHPGRSNAYLVNARRRLAIIYNDISVLENTHASKTFESLQEKESNFLAPAQNEDYRCFRKTVIELILATDMKLHFELINNYKVRTGLLSDRFQLKRGTPEFKPFSDENKMSTLKLIMKAADVSHAAMEWTVHQKLSMDINEELWAQGDAEEKLGLPKSPLCDRAKAHELASQQAGFLEVVVSPLYVQLAEIDMSGFVSGTCQSAIKANTAKWRVMAASQTITSLQQQDSTKTGRKSSGIPLRENLDDRDSGSTCNLVISANGNGGTGFELLSPASTAHVSIVSTAELDSTSRPFRTAPAREP